MDQHIEQKENADILWMTFLNAFFKWSIFIAIGIPSKCPFRNLIDTLSFVRIMAWCSQSASHYLNRCWPRSTTWYDGTRPQWVKSVQLWEQMLNRNAPYSKDHGANMGPTWVLSAPDGPHVGSMNLAIRGWFATISIWRVGWRQNM